MKRALVPCILALLSIGSSSAAESYVYRILTIPGSDVDVFTIGFYADHAAFAAGSSMTEEQREAAAKQAGFTGVDGIAPYLRSLIGRHQDTLAVPVD